MQSKRSAAGEQLISGPRTTPTTAAAHLCAKTRFVAGNRWKRNIRNCLHSEAISSFTFGKTRPALFKRSRERKVIVGGQTVYTKEKKVAWPGAKKPK